MALILRQTKGSPLTISELDGNFTYLDTKEKQSYSITIANDGETLNYYPIYFVNMRGYWINYNYWNLYLTYGNYSNDVFNTANYVLVTSNNDGDSSGGVYEDGTYLNGTFQGDVNGASSSTWSNNYLFPNGPGLTAFNGYVFESDNGDGTFAGYQGGYGLQMNPDSFSTGVIMPDPSANAGKSSLFIRTDYYQSVTESYFPIVGNFYTEYGTIETTYSISQSGSSVQFLSDGTYWIPVSAFGS